GLYFYRARYYHPQLQRFISEDPIEFAGGDINLYSYVLNNPVAFSDPTGESFRVVCRRVARFLKGWGRIIVLVCELLGGESGPRPPNLPPPSPPGRSAPPKGPKGFAPPIPPGNPGPSGGRKDDAPEPKPPPFDTSDCYESGVCI
ncbi:MAG: RHS repeat-associated core domain-containing protein, partial [Nitrososphaeraceae archaeon]